MAKHVIVNRPFMFGGHRFSRDVHTLTFDSSREAKDGTTLEDQANVIIKGREMTDIAMEGYLGGYGDAPTETSEQKLVQELDDDGDGMLLHFLFGGSAIGDFSAFQIAKMMGLNLGGQQGEVAPFSATVRGTQPFYWGRVLFAALTGDGATATANGAALQLGALAANRRRVFAVSTADSSNSTGSTRTLDVDIESDVADDFSGAETVRASITQLTADGWRIFELSGDDAAITDTWWRAAITIGGTDDPAFPVMISVADRIINPQAE